jgi:hypothetical protein
MEDTIKHKRVVIMQMSVPQGQYALPNFYIAYILRKGFLKYLCTSYDQAIASQAEKYNVSHEFKITIIQFKLLGKDSNLGL